MLQTQVAALTSTAATTSTTATPTPAVIVFADTPQSLNTKDLLDYVTKRASSIYEQGCKTLDKKALTNGFSMTANQTVVLIETLKGHLKTDKHLKDALNNGKKMHNKKKGGDKAKQNEDEEWKRVPPKDGDKKSMVVGKYTYHWCMHHMTWCMHLPADCHLSKERREEQQKTTPAYVANSATYALLPLPLSTPTSKFFLPPWATTMRMNDGASRHVCCRYF